MISPGNHQEFEPPSPAEAAQKYCPHAVRANESYQRCNCHDHCDTRLRNLSQMAAMITVKTAIRPDRTRPAG